MSRNSYLFTSESVSEGHPDKVCDQISDEVVDAFIKADPESRVACETLATTNLVVIAGETRGPKNINEKFIEQLAKETIRKIGYEQKGFNWQDVKIQNHLHQQSPDIAQGVDKDGAGDQGIMFGYACNETAELMPAPILFAHRILQAISTARKSGKEQQLGPDAKSQITVRYQDGKAVGIESIVISTQHIDENLTSKDVQAIIEPYVYEVIPHDWIDSTHTTWHVNPTGKFVIGGPDGDAGLTGRKIIVDTYGGAAPHGGGAFSGKDPTKVDRSAAYMARYIAKNIVAAELAQKCTIQLSYAIGVADPQSVLVDLHGTGNIDENKIERQLMNRDFIDLTPRGIRDHLSLNKPIYARTAAYGHFGRKPDDDGGFSWEKTDFVTNLQSIQ